MQLQQGRSKRALWSPSHYTQVFQIRHFLSYFVFRHAGTLRVKSMSNLSYSRGAQGLQYCEDLGHENDKKNTIFCHRLVTFPKALVKRSMRMHNDSWFFPKYPSVSPQNIIKHSQCK